MKHRQQNGMSFTRTMRWLEGRRGVRRGASLVLALLLATIAPAALPGHAAGTPPFAGTFIGQGVATFVPPNQVHLAVTDDGTGTLVGHAVLTKSATVTLSAVPCGSGRVVTTYTETATLTAANGDTLNLSGGGVDCHSDAGTSASGTLTVTGGGGRFAGASGQLTESIVDNASDFETSHLTGWISSPGSNR